MLVFVSRWGGSWVGVADGGAEVSDGGLFPRVWGTCRNNKSSEIVL